MFSLTRAVDRPALRIRVSIAARQMAKTRQLASTNICFVSGLSTYLFFESDEVFLGVYASLRAELSQLLPPLVLNLRKQQANEKRISLFVHSEQFLCLNRRAGPRHEVTEAHKRSQTHGWRDVKTHQHGNQCADAAM